ncbi:MAG: hypothetical protein RBS58_06420 [Syntrophales bacterium]|nr:hypothetical protein [Syntrophales bacterium]MDX9922273.1 hypothetical protein [Syntrophales bacterium]
MLHPVAQGAEVIRARKPRHLPVVMTRAEVREVPANLSGDKRLVAAMNAVGTRNN